MNILSVSKKMFGTIILASFLLLCLFIWKRLRYFKNHGIPHEPGYFPFGSPCTFKALKGEYSFFTICEEIYKKYPQHRVFGYYGLFGQPILVIRDLDIAKRVLIKDFDHFMHRGFDVEALHPEANKHFKNMTVVLKDEKWKIMRTTLTPIFTSGKIKATLPAANNAGTKFCQYLEKIEHEPDIDFKEEFQKFTAEVLGIIGCGITPNVFENTENNVYYEQVKALIGGGKPDFKQVATIMGLMTVPKLVTLSRAELFNRKAETFFDSIIRQTLQERKRSKEKKNDFIDMFSEALNGLEGKNRDAFKAAFPDSSVEDIVVSNGILLFFAGFDTTSSGLSIAALFLANHPNIQEKLYQEIKTMIEENDDDPCLDYDKIHSIKLLDSVIKDALRLWGFNFLDRICNKPYFMKEINFTVPKGMLVQIGAGQIMRDGKYYKCPKTFDPEANFDDDSLYSPAFLAFGQGPRACIGMRFALFMIRVALIHSLAKYRFVPSSKTITEIIIDPESAQIFPKGGVHFCIQRRQ